MMSEMSSRDPNSNMSNISPSDSTPILNKTNNPWQILSNSDLAEPKGSITLTGKQQQPGLSHVQSSIPTGVVTLFNKMKSHVSVATGSTGSLMNVTHSDQIKSLQQIAESLESIISSSLYGDFAAFLTPLFLGYLQSSSAQFIAEIPEQQIRKQMLEILYRLPANDTLKAHSKSILSLMFKLLETDNEENVLFCLRIIIEHHKSYRPQHSNEITTFLEFVHKIYSDLSENVAAIFAGPQVGADGEFSIDCAGMVSQMTITTTTTGGQQLTQTIIPKAQMSLKVLAELPLITVLFYQLYKNQVHKIIGDLFPIVTKSLSHQPPKRNAEGTNTGTSSFSDELYVDFMTAQVKTLSFVAYGLKVYPEIIRQYAQPLAASVIGLLKSCPSEVTHLRKEIMVATKHIFASELLRNSFLPFVNELFDESVLIGSAYSVRESLRALCYNTLADLVNQIKNSLPFTETAKAIHYFSKVLLDDSLPASLQATSAKLLLNLGAELFNAKMASSSASQLDNSNTEQIRQIQLRLLEVFVAKFKTISEYQLPLIMKKCQDQIKAEEAKKQQQNADNSSPPSEEQQQNHPQYEATANSEVVGSTMDVDTSDVENNPECSKTRPEDSKSRVCDGATDTKTTSSSQPRKDSKPSATGSTSISVSNTSNVVSVMTASECRNLVRLLVMGAKTISNSVNALSGNFDSPRGPNSHASLGYQPAVVEILRDLLRYALRALDIYLISYTQQGVPIIRAANSTATNGTNAAPRMKEEKELLEWFAQIYTFQPVTTFREVFLDAIEFMVQRIRENYALQIIINSFLATASTSPTFATILVEYLLERMEAIGGGCAIGDRIAVSLESGCLADKKDNLDTSNLYLKLFKLVFGSVSLLASANEQMLKPHLHAIVNKSMQMALTARDPINYFYLLRALFRSIGGGSHDLLYQEFLPLLCNLLQGLNVLQNGHHKSQVKDLFVELSLTVPVRLSSLLPYLPLLMGPLVSALKGSSALVNQGLRTLELFVDNLQPDFLYDHIQPVRAELMQALWKTVRNPNPLLATTAFRVLGKFGGANRNMLKEPQTLQYKNIELKIPSSNTNGVHLKFSGTRTWAVLEIDDVISTAASCITGSNEEDFYKIEGFQIIQSYILLLLKSASHTLPPGYESVLEKAKLWVPNKVVVYQCEFGRRNDRVNWSVNKIVKDALVMLFYACNVECVKEQAQSLTKFVVKKLAHLSIIRALRSSCDNSFKEEGHCSKDDASLAETHPFNDLIIVDSIVRALCKTEEAQTKKASSLHLIDLLVNSCSELLTPETFSHLPIFQCLLERVCECFYEKAWFVKLTGCLVLEKVLDSLSSNFLLLNQSKIIRSLQFTMVDFGGDVSNGVLESICIVMENVLQKCFTPLNKNGASSSEEDSKLKELKEISMDKVVHDLTREITSPNKILREQMVRCLKFVTRVTGSSLHDLLLSQKTQLQEIVPPVKHRLRYLPFNTQIGLMFANAFLLSSAVTPRMFSYDMKLNDHADYLEELFYLCESDDDNLKKLAISNKVSSFDLFTLREAALRNLAACYFITEDSQHDRIFSVLYESLNSTNDQIQSLGEKCMETFLSKCGKDKRQKAYEHMRELLKSLMSSYKVLNLNVVARLSTLSTLFPQSFNERFCRSIVMEHLTYWVRDMTEIRRSGGLEADYFLELKTSSQIINMFHLLPTAPVSLVEPLIDMVINTEECLARDFANPMRPPLAKFLAQHSETTCVFFMRQENLKNEKKLSFFLFMLGHPEGRPIMAWLMSHGPFFVKSGLACALENPQDNINFTIQNNLIRILNLACEIDDTWIANQTEIVSYLREIWTSVELDKRHGSGSLDCDVNWKEVQCLVTCLLSAFKHDSNYPDAGFLFSIVRALTSNYLCDNLRLKCFLSEHLTHLSAQAKRKLFFSFTDIFVDAFKDTECKAKMITMVFIPAFRSTMVVDEYVDELIGEKANPESESPNNLLNVFLSKFVNSNQRYPESVRIAILQLACLFVQYCAPHIHDAVSKRQQGQKMRKLMGFAWPCLLPKACVDPSTKYHGHLLLVHIIAKFPINKKIVLQVFYSLLKAHGQETRSVIRESLDLLTPSLAIRMEDGDAMLAHWTKKIMIEEGHALPQMLHIVWLIVKQQEIFYRVRGSLSNMMLNCMNRLVFSSSVSLENKRQAIDVAEVFIQWQETSNREENTTASSAEPKDLSMEDPEDQTGLDSEKQRTAETVINFLMRIAASIHDASNANNPQCDSYVSRCISLLESAFSTKVWGNLKVDVRLFWMDKLLLSAEQSNTNMLNLISCVQLLQFCLKTLPLHMTITNLRSLNRGLTSFLHCKSSRLYKPFHDFLMKLIKLAPPSNSSLLAAPIKTSNVSSSAGTPGVPGQSSPGVGSSSQQANQQVSGETIEVDSMTSPSLYSELDPFYDSVYRCILDGLQTYEKSSPMVTYKVAQPAISLLNGVYAETEISFDDSLTERSVRCLQRLVREHLTPVQANQIDHCLTELIIILITVLQSRIKTMSSELRKLFLHALLVSLIEKSADVKLIQNVIEIINRWVRGGCEGVTSPTSQQRAYGLSPTLREKSLLLFKMMNCLDKRYPDETSLHKAFLETVLFIYKDPVLGASELVNKLEPAFMSGLKFSDATLRCEFFETWRVSVGSSVYKQLLYIICAQNWESMHDHFWIKQCVQLILSADKDDSCLFMGGRKPVYEGNDSGVEKAPFDGKNCNSNTSENKLGVKMELCGHTETSASSTLNSLMSEFHDVMLQSKDQLMQKMFTSLCKFSHKSTDLAHALFVALFPQIWASLKIDEQSTLCAELNAFLVSGAHLVQRDVPNSCIKTFLEALAQCTPTVMLRPTVLKYIGRSHNAWHRCLIWLENVYEKQHPGGSLQFMSLKDAPMVSQQQSSSQTKSLNSAFNQYYDTVDANVYQVRDTFENLAAMCQSLHEEDLWAALWSSHSLYPETCAAISYQVQGLFIEAQQKYEEVMGSTKTQLDSTVASPNALGEYQLWEQEWMKCCRQLNEWDILAEISKSDDHPNPHLILDCAWRSQDWKKVEDTLNIVEINSARESAWRYQLLRGYLSVFKPDSPQVQVNTSTSDHSMMNSSGATGGGGSNNNQQQALETAVSNGMSLAIKEWNRLPHVISLNHIPILQGAHQLVEVTEAHQIQVGISQQSINRQSSLHDMKAVIKTWKNRLGTTSDDLSYWSDLFLWRHHSYSAIINAFEVNQQMSPFSHSLHSPNASSETPNNPYAMQGVHAQAQAIIAFGRFARKQGLYSVCLEALARIHAIASVPIVDCYQKILQQIKCYLKLSAGVDVQELRKGLDVIDQTNLKYFNPEMISDFYALKGLFLNLLAESEEANKAFSAAVQFNDNSIKSWSYWGDYFKSVFLSTKDTESAKSAILCYLHSCRHQKEGKTRVNMAKILSFLPHDDDTCQLAEAIEKCSSGVPAIHWIQWIPQLTSSLVRKEGNNIFGILLTVGKAHPQAVYYPIRTLYTYLKNRIQQDQQGDMPSLSPMKDASSSNSVPDKTVTPQLVTRDAQGGSTCQVMSEPTLDSGAVTTAMDASSSGFPNKDQPLDSTYSAAEPESWKSESKPEAELSSMEITQNVNNCSVSSAIKSPSPRPPSTNSVLSSKSWRGGTMSSVYSKYKSPLKFCTKIIFTQRDAHPTLLAALESVADQLHTIPQVWFESLLQQLDSMLKHQLQIAFENPQIAYSATLCDSTLTSLNVFLLSVRSLKEDRMSNNSEKQHKDKGVALHQEFAHQFEWLDPDFEDICARLEADFDFSDPVTARPLPLLNKLRKWISFFEQKLGTYAGCGTKAFRLDKKCRFLTNFSVETAEIDVPADFISLKNSSYSLKVARFLPKCEIVRRNQTTFRRIFIRATNGKVFNYRLTSSQHSSNVYTGQTLSTGSSSSFAYGDEKIAQLMRLTQSYFLDKKKETCRRLLYFSPPSVTTMAPDLRLHLENKSTVSLYDIYNQSCCNNNIKADDAIKRYYEEMFCSSSSSSSLPNMVTAELEDMMDKVEDDKDSVQRQKVFCLIQRTLVPKSRLREWALALYNDPAEYFAFRKQFTNHLSLISTLSHLLKLNCVSANGLDVVKETGFLTLANFRFSEQLNRTNSGDIVGNSGRRRIRSAAPQQPLTCMRLTPNVVDLMGPLGIQGPFLQNTLAVCVALVDPQCKFQAFVSTFIQDCAILFDEAAVSSTNADQSSNEDLLNYRDSWTRESIERLHTIAASVIEQSLHLNKIIKQSADVSNISHIDPACIPWF